MYPRGKSNVPCDSRRVSGVRTQPGSVALQRERSSRLTTSPHRFLPYNPIFRTYSATAGFTSFAQSLAARRPPHELRSTKLSDAHHPAAGSSLLAAPGLRSLPACGKDLVTACRRPHLFWQRVRHVRQRISRTARDNKLALSQKCARFVPLSDVQKGVDPDQKKQLVALPQSLLQAADRLDRVIRALRFSTRPFPLPEPPDSPAATAPPAATGKNVLSSAVASATIAYRWKKSLTGCFCLCGGTLAGTNKTRCKLNFSVAARASAMCPRWIGSNVPPSRPMFMRLVRVSPLVSCFVLALASFCGMVAQNPRHVEDLARRTSRRVSQPRRYLLSKVALQRRDVRLGRGLSAASC